MQTPSTSPLLRIGTRGSPLALVQARDVQQKLSALHGVAPDRIPITIIKTDGDRTQSENTSLKDIGGKGLFSREIETALINNEIDIGVHSAKDMATTLPDGLVMPVFLERQDVRDTFISPHATRPEDLPQNAKLGTSSLRRAAQFLRLRPDLQIVEFRGNVDTRLQKLKAGIADATLLAMAGLNRLGRSEIAQNPLDATQFPTAPAQGAVAIEYRNDDTQIADLVAPLNHAPTHAAVSAERAMLKIIDGSCRTPIGVFTRHEHDQLHIQAEILSPDGREHFSAKTSGAHHAAADLGARLGNDLLAQAGPEFFARLKAL